MISISCADLMPRHALVIASAVAICSAGRASASSLNTKVRALPFDLRRRRVGWQRPIRLACGTRGGVGVELIGKSGIGTEPKYRRTGSEGHTALDELSAFHTIPEARVGPKVYIRASARLIRMIKQLRPRLAVAMIAVATRLGAQVGAAPTAPASSSKAKGEIVGVVVDS